MEKYQAQNLVSDGALGKMILLNICDHFILALLKHRGVSLEPKGEQHGTLQKRKYLVDYN